MNQVESEDICLICMEVVKIPVLPALLCNCSVTVCLNCFRDYMDLNKSQHEQDLTRRKCLICRKEMKAVSNDQLYTKLPRRFLSNLDKKYGNFDCPRSCGWSGSRVELDETHIKVCPEGFYSCLTCRWFGKRKAHSIKCDYCEKVMDACVLQKHIEKCDKFPKCDTCRESIYDHESCFCEYCNKRITFCPNYGRHLFYRSHQKECTVKYCNSCDMAIVDGSHEEKCKNCGGVFPECELKNHHAFQCPKTFVKKDGNIFNVDRPDEFCRKCHRCGFLVLFTIEGDVQHENLCMTFLDIRRSLLQK